MLQSKAALIVAEVAQKGDLTSLVVTIILDYNIHKEIIIDKDRHTEITHNFDLHLTLWYIQS